MRYLKFALLLIVLGLFNGFIYNSYSLVTSLTDGSYVYPLDDVYIHMAMAKSLALHSNWGVTANEFCSTSSSPLFTFLIASCIKVFGDSPMHPFWLNLVFANGLIILLFAFFKKNSIAFLGMMMALVSPVLLHLQVLNGMEHTFHILVILLGFIALYKLIHCDFRIRKYVYMLLGATLLMCLTRYESMFFICPMLLVLILYKQYKLAIATLFAGFLPMVLFGLYSIANGGYFFPNSLLLKSTSYDHSLFHYAYTYTMNIWHHFCVPLVLIPVGILLTVMIVDLFVNKPFSIKGLLGYLKKYALVLMVFITIVEHALFAAVGWLFRYEAYLFALLYIVLIVTLIDVALALKSKYQPSNKKVAVISLLAIILLLVPVCISGHERFEGAKLLIGTANKNVYDQQIQMSRFLKKYYNNSKVTANDIGAITYFTNIDLLDLVGLGSVSILEEKIALRESWLDTSLVQSDKLGKAPYNVYNIIILYDRWFHIETKKDYEHIGWIKTGELKIENNIICGDDTVSFYTSDPEEAPKMREHLREFKNEVPKDVTITIFEEEVTQVQE